LELAKALIFAGTMSVTTGRVPEGTKQLEQAAAICRRIGIGGEQGQVAQVHLAQALNKLGVAVGRPGDNARAIEYIREALAIYRDLASREPDDRQYRAGVAWTAHGLAAGLQTQNDPEAAIPLYEECLKILDDFAETDADPESSIQSAAGTRINLASIRLAEGNLTEAEALSQRALADLEGLHSKSPNNTEIVLNLTSGMLGHSNLLGLQEQFEPAAAICARARQIVIKALKREPNIRALRENRFLLTANQAHYEGMAKRYPEAASSWRLAIDAALDDANRLYSRQLRVRCLARADQLDEAWRELRAIEPSSLQGEDAFRQASCWAILAQGLGRQEKPISDKANQAVEAASLALELLEQLNREGQLTSAQKEHLESSDDWESLPTLVSEDRWRAVRN
jgi:tetratricopeptide (TPR) repeat protein